MLSSSVLLLLAAGSAVLAQSNGCQPGYEFGTDTVLFTTPYTYAQVMSIIGSYKNLTWSGNPDDTVTLDGVRFFPLTLSSLFLPYLPSIPITLSRHPESAPDPLSPSHLLPTNFKPNSPTIPSIQPVRT